MEKALLEKLEAPTEEAKKAGDKNDDSLDLARFGWDETEKIGCNTWKLLYLGVIYIRAKI